MGTPWLQTYDPLHNPVLSTVVAALPVVVLLGSIAILRIRIHFSALLGLSTALAVALLAYRMPAKIAVAASLYGAAFGLFPIGWIILNVIFLYQLTVKRGLFEVLRDSLATLAPDPRVQVILIAFSFGAFIEGISGFGTPVAITGAILIQLGFKPLHASGLALIANTAPVAFGSLGIPITTLEQVTGLDALKISAMVGRQLTFFSLLVPFWVVAAFAGWRGLCGVWPAALVAGLAFAVPQFLVSNFHGPWLVGITSGACSIAALVGLMRFWRPRDGWVAAGPCAPQQGRSSAAAEDRQIEPATAALLRDAATKENVIELVNGPAPGGSSAGATTTQVARLQASPGRTFQGWMPWVILTGFILLWGLPQFKATLDGIAAPKLAVPYLHQLVQRVPPVVSADAKPETAEFRLNILSATGTSILLAAIVAGIAMGFGPGQLAKTWLETLWRVRFSLLTIAAMLAIGNVTKYSGTDATLGLALAHTGWFYPFFGTLLGLAGRGAYGFRHLLQRAVRQPAKDHCRADRPEPHPHGGCQQLRRRHGQDGGRPEHRGRQHRHQLVRARGQHPALRLLP